MELEAVRYDKAWQKTYDHALEKITKAKDIIPENKKPIVDFLRHLDSRQSKPRTKLRYLYTYEKLLRCMPSKKIPILKATREQLEEAVIHINELPLSEATKAKIRICLKAVYTHFNGEVGPDGKAIYTPKEVAFVSTVEKKGKERLTYSDLLTDDEVTKLLDNTLNLRDKFLIALMIDAPLRTHEILRLQRKHLYVEGNPAYLQIPADTKTGSRRIPLVNSVPYALQYLESNKGLTSEDPLFLHEVWNKEKKPLTYAGLRSMLHKVAIRAKIDPAKVYPYAFRHRWISVMSSKLSNAVVENVAGWKHGTNMHEVYQHMSPSQDDVEVRKAYGIKTEEKEAAGPRLRITICKVCGNSCSANSMFCSRCGRALSQEIALQQENLQRVAVKSAVDPEYLAQVVAAEVEKRLKKK